MLGLCSSVLRLLFIASSITNAFVMSHAGGLSRRVHMQGDSGFEETSLAPRLKGLAAFDAAITAASGAEEAVCVRFMAKSCPSCKRMGIYYKKMMRELADAGVGGVRFFDCEAQESKDVVSALKALAPADQAPTEFSAMPWIYLYSKSGALLHSFPCGATKLPLLKERVLMAAA